MEDRTPPSKHPIRARSVALDFDADIPRHWIGGNAFATHVANGVNLLFPAGERFFVRSVRHYLDRIDDPELLEQVRGFCAQEGRHANAHQRFFEVLERQGYEIRDFLRVYEAIGYGFIERVAPRSVALATTVALEHFTALLAEAALTGRLFDEKTDPVVERLLLWHAAEEIEHKAVAFDVLKRVDPSYALRLIGLFMATLCLGGFWMLAVPVLLWQDGLLGRRRLFREMAESARRYPVLRQVFVRGIREYLRRDFHPWNNENGHLAEDYLATSGLEA
jgi:uncharacterized protein